MKKNETMRDVRARRKEQREWARKNPRPSALPVARKQRDVAEEHREVLRSWRTPSRTPNAGGYPRKRADR